MRRRFLERGGCVLVLWIAGAACGGPTLPPPARSFGVSNPAAGTGATPAAPAPGAPRLYPESTDGMPTFGREPGGGTRVMKEGRRFLARPDGGMESAASAGLPSWTVVDIIPQRLGGGFLFRDRKGAAQLFRSDTWLGPVRAFYTHYADVAEVWFGVDRMYLLSGNGARLALDPSGAQLDPGALPAAPHVRGVAAIDGWNALAVTGSRGVLLSHDAGATWQPAFLPIEPTVTWADEGVFHVQGFNTDSKLTSFTVRRDGTFVEEKLTTEPARPVPRPPDVFGAVPLARAVSSGIPLAGGTALVAKDGHLGHVQLDTGVVIEKREAFDMRSSTCQSVLLSTKASAPQRWGFVCGEPKGRTVIYAIDDGAMRPLKTFAAPRAVFPSGEGGMAIRGSCEPEATPTPLPGATKRRPYCIYHPTLGFREIVLTGNVGAERVVVLGDGRVAILTPPAFDLTTARLTIIDRSGAAKTTPVVFPTASPPVRALLAGGLWLDGFELRGDDKIGGWVQAGTTVLGVEVALDGNVRFGEHIVDTGNPVVSGRYGLGWTNSGRGFETVDGGMSWHPVDMPVPVADAEKNPERGCSAIGCRMHGWIRVGWGSGSVARPTALPAARPPTRTDHPPLRLECDTTADKPVPTNAPGAYRIGASSGGKLVDTVAEAGPFRGLVGPPLKRTDRAYILDANASLGRQNPKAEARLVAVGPKSTTWDEQNVSFMIEWAGPFDVRGHASALLPAPSYLVEAGRTVAPTPGIRRHSPSSFYGAVAITVGADSRHALVTIRRPGVLGLVAYALSEDRPPLEIKRGDGEPWADLDDGVFADRTWFVSGTATSVAARRGALDRNYPRVAIYRVDGAVAREIATVKRPQNRLGLPTLVHEYGGRRIGVLVEGDPLSGSNLPQIWVTPIDPESGQIGDAEMLASSDLSDVSTLSVCDDPARGWMWHASLASRKSDWNLSTDRASGYRGVNARVITSARGTCIQNLHVSLRDAPATATTLRGRANTVLVRDGRTSAASCRVPVTMSVMP